MIGSAVNVLWEYILFFTFVKSGPGKLLCCSLTHCVLIMSLWAQSKAEKPHDESDSTFSS